MSILFDEIFIENLVDKHMSKIEEYANLTDEESMTRDYPGAPSYLEVYYTGLIEVNELFSEDQRNTVSDLIDSSYFKYMLQQDLLNTMKNNGILGEELRDFDTFILDKADVEIKIKGDKIFCEVNYDGSI